MIVLSPICLVAGATLACLASKRPDRQTIVELAGGALMVAGLCLIGFSMPVFR